MRTIERVLSDHDIERFELDGYVPVRQAVPPAVLAECTHQLHQHPTHQPLFPLRVCHDILFLTGNLTLQTAPGSAPTNH